MQKWEYHTVVSMSGLNDKKLNEYGAGGWELIFVAEATVAWTYYFKRPIG